MNKSSYILSFYLISALQQSYSMEQEAIQPIDIINYPYAQHVYCFSNNTFEIVGMKECTLYNSCNQPIANQTFKSIISNCIACPQKALLALSASTLQIFCAQQKKQLFPPNVCSKSFLTFNSLHEELITCDLFSNTIGIYNYNNGELKNTLLLQNNQDIVYPGISYNQSTQQLVAYVEEKHPTERAQGKLFFFKKSQSGEFIKTDSIKKSQYLFAMFFINEFLLTLHAPHKGFYLYNSQRKKISEHQVFVNALAIFPKNSNFFITYSIRDGTISFWNINSMKQPLAILHINQSSICKRESYLHHKDILSVSYNEQRIFLITDNKCVIFKMPFEILRDQKAYILQTQKKCISLLLCLHALDSFCFMPSELKKLLIKHLLTVCIFKANEQ